MSSGSARALDPGGIGSAARTVAPVAIERVDFACPARSASATYAKRTGQNDRGCTILLSLPRQGVV